MGTKMYQQSYLLAVYLEEQQQKKLQEHFSQFGAIKDVYIPTPPRGYGFVTFASQVGSNKAIKETHSIKGQFLNVSVPNEKKMPGMFYQSNPGFGNMQGGGFGNMQGGGFGNMQGGMQYHQMGNMQSNIAGGMNAKPWMQGNMLAQNYGPNNQSGFGYGYQKNGNYSNLGSRQKGQMVS